MKKYPIVQNKLMMQIPGRLVTQTTKRWKRLSLEEMMGLIWQKRDTECEVLFMRGNVGIDQPPVLWRAEIRWEQGDQVLHCYDEERRNRLYMVLHSRDYVTERSKFFSELREFLPFPEDAVWICNHTHRIILEVT